MGAPAPWTTRWAEPAFDPFDPDLDENDPFLNPDYEIEENPSEDPYNLPEDALFLQAVTWGVTHPCNLRCTHCYDVVPEKRHDLSTLQALEVIQRLGQLGCQVVIFSGGEPLLRRDLFALLNACQAEGMMFGIRSNGTLITPMIADQFADLGLAVAGISLDGANAMAHDAIRGQGTFNRTLHAVRLLVERGIRVNLEVVLSRQNAHTILDLVALGESLGVTEMNFSTLTPQGRGQNLIADYLDYATWRELTNTLYTLSQTSSMAISPSCALVGACVACYQPNITCEGWVTPCYLSKRKLFHILETPLAEIINQLQAARLGHLDVCGRAAWAQKMSQKRVLA